MRRRFFQSSRCSECTRDRLALDPLALFCHVRDLSSSLAEPSRNGRRAFDFFATLVRLLLVRSIRHAPMKYEVKKPGTWAWTTVDSGSLVQEVENGRIGQDWQVWRSGTSEEFTVRQLLEELGVQPSVASVQIAEMPSRGQPVQSSNGQRIQSSSAEIELLQQLVLLNTKQLYWIRVIGVIVLGAWVATQLYSCSRHP